MAMTNEQMIWVRSHVGDAPPTEDDLNDLFDVYGNIEQTVENVLATRLANLINKPASFSVGRGKYAQNTGANITALSNQLRDFRETHLSASAYRVLPKALVRSRSCGCHTALCPHYPAILR